MARGLINQTVSQFTVSTTSDKRLDNSLPKGLPCLLHPTTYPTAHPNGFEHHVGRVDQDGLGASIFNVLASPGQ
jgi:hypothetical protein